MLEGVVIRNNRNNDISMCGNTTVVSAYTLYRHLEQYLSHPSICIPSYVESFPK